MTSTLRSNSYNMRVLSVLLLCSAVYAASISPQDDADDVVAALDEISNGRELTAPQTPGFVLTFSVDAISAQIDELSEGDTD